LTLPSTPTDAAARSRATPGAAAEGTGNDCDLLTGTSCQMTIEEAFLCSILDDIHDPLRRLVFADWLDDHSDPRAEWLRIDCELARLGQQDDRRPALEARKRELGESPIRTLATGQG